MLAAAIHLSLNDATKAVQKLILCNNLEYAYMVASLFLPKPSVDQVLVLLIAKAQDSKCLELAQQLIDNVSDAQLRCILGSGLKQIASLSKVSPGDFQLSDQPLPSARPINSKLVKQLLDINISDACLSAIQCFTENEVTGILRAEVFESFYFLGLFELREVESR